MPDARVAQMLDHFTQYVGSSPYGSPAVLCGIAHMQTDDGVWYPRGGTRAVPAALERSPASLGVEIRLDTGVRRIVTRQGRAARGVETARGERSPGRRGLQHGCRADLPRAGRRRRGGQRSSAAAATSPPAPAWCSISASTARYDHLLHHNFVFSARPRGGVRLDLPQGRAGARSDLLPRGPGAHRPGVAPPGGEALYVLVHTPYLRPAPRLEPDAPGYRRIILDKLARTAGLEDLEQRIASSAA